MTAPKSTFEKILALQGAATVMAPKIIGRVIDQIARGFDKDENIPHELCLYKAIQAKYPEDTVTLPEMFKSMVRRAKTTADVDLSFEGMTDEEKSLWSAGQEGSERDSLMAAMPALTKLYMLAEPDPERWDDLPVIAQWSLLNSMETTIPQKLALYSGWANTDRAAGKTNTNAMRLEKLSKAAVTGSYKIITAYLNDPTVQAELAQSLEAGINVPPRLAVAS